MIHTIIYNGRYSLNYQRLLDQKEDLSSFTTYIDEDGVKKEIDPISEKVDGIVFGYMEKTKKKPSDDRFWAVRVGNKALDIPIKLVPEQHTDGKWFGPSSSQFGDKSAKQLLKDIIHEYSKQEKELESIYDKYFSSILEEIGK